MAAFMLARVSAQKAGQTLFSAQAVDQALTLIQRATEEDFYEGLLKIPSISTTKRLPAVVLWHHGMRMKFTTTLQQPFAVQDVECTVVGFDPDDNDYETKVIWIIRGTSAVALIASFSVLYCMSSRLAFH